VTTFVIEEEEASPTEILKNEQITESEEKAAQII
jgi:hypothetical protein